MNDLHHKDMELLFPGEKSAEIAGNYVLRMQQVNQCYNDFIMCVCVCTHA